MTGYTVDNAQDVYVVKTDSSGNEMWQGSYGGNRNDGGSAIIRTNDQGYLIVGSSKSFSASDDDEDLYIVKIDNSGTLLWDEIYGGRSKDAASCVREDTPSGYVISGSSGSNSRSSNLYILKVDPTGQIQ